jgi:diguanylate cyclase (GGDEF)-like protein
VFTTHLVIATIMAATLGAAIGFGTNFMITRPTIRRLRVRLADAAWKLTHDPLTGLPNRSGLRTDHAAVAASGQPQPVAVMLIDLDLFKDVNDTHGHDAGDDLLIEIADRLGHLAAVFGGSAARLAGDEFVAIMPLRRHQVTSLAEMFNAVIAEPVKIQADNDPVTVTVTASLGIAVVSSTDPLEDTGLHRADTAMYHAKREGRNRHVLYTTGMTMPDRQPRRGPRLRDLRRDHSGSAQ